MMNAARHNIDEAAARKDIVSHITYTGHVC